MDSYPHLDAKPTRAGTTSVAGQLLRVIFGSYFVVTLIVTCIQLVAEYRNTEQRVSAEIQAMRQTFGPGIADAMWRFQDEVLRGILDGIKELPVVVGVTVEDEGGHLVRAAGIILAKNGQSIRILPDGTVIPADHERGVFSEEITHAFPIIYTDENGNQRNIGRWRVFSNKRVILGQVKYGFTLILVNSIIKTAALWFIFLFVVTHWLGNPLDQLSRFVSRINLENLDSHAIALKTPGRHELHLLAEAVNVMLGKLRGSLAENNALVQDLKAEKEALRLLNETLESRVAERTEELERLNRQLETLSVTDGLTGIANRRCFDQTLEIEWARASRTGVPLALALLDVDWFKRYNDHYGHLAGDACLRAVAAVLADTARRTGDLVARYGGEEFAFIAPAADGPTALAMGIRICEALRARALPHELSRFHCLTVSIGVATLVPAIGQSRDALLKAADQALYRAKKQGRNTVVLADGQTGDGAAA